MTRDSETFGRRLIGITADKFLVLKEPSDYSEHFRTLDQIIFYYLTRSLNGQRVVEIHDGVAYNTMSLLNPPPDQEEFLKLNYLLTVQQSRGAWYLPEVVKIRGSLLNLPGNSIEYPRFANGIGRSDDCRVRLDRVPDSLFIWSVLSPLFESLFAALNLRGPLSGTMKRDAQIEAWEVVHRFFADIQLDLSDELSVFTYGGGWSKLHAADQIKAKHRFLVAVRERISLDTVRCYRLLLMRPLVERYYLKAKRQTPLMRQVLTKPLQRVVSGLFCGDWLMFVDYLGEAPNSEERIASALPDIPIFIHGSSRATEVARVQGVPVEEVERILSILWNSSSPISPIERRTQVLTKYWCELEAIQSSQVSGMRPLWGMIEERRIVQLDAFYNRYGSFDEIHTPGLYASYLSSNILADIESLWGTKVLKGWPDRLVTEPLPITLMQDALGPALKFWHGCALTVWFICEGPSSRTDLQGLTVYYRADLAALEEMGCPVNKELFSDLLAVESLLGKKTDRLEPRVNSEYGIGFSIGYDNRRDGFEHLRDVVSAHMRAWSINYFESYLQTRWQSDIQGVGRQFYQMIEQKGKSPSLRQFAQHALIPANRWFGGNIGALFSSFGDKSLALPTYRRQLPLGPQSFAQAVFKELGGRTTNWSQVGKIQDDVRRTQVWDKYNGLIELAHLSIYYVQVREALERIPKFDEFINSRIQLLLQFIDVDQDKAWKRYSRKIEKVLHSMDTTAT